MGRYLAIDYGKKRTGLAVTDENRLIAGPLDTVETSRLMSYLKNYCAQQEVECFVVGKPLRWSGEDSEVSVFIEPFVRSLEKTFPGIRVDRMDERFTSLMASRTLLEAGLKKKDRRDKALVDKVAAVIILQSYMEFIKNHQHS